MRMRSRCLGILAIGVLVLGVGVQAAPRDSGGTKVKSDVGRLVAGDGAHLRSVLDGGTAGVSTFVGIKNDYLGLDGLPVQLFFEIHLGGWGGVLHRGLAACP